MLAFARRPLSRDTPKNEEQVEHDLTLLGVVGIIDPWRSEVPIAIRLARTEGISVVMITGDAPDTALAIGRQMSLDVTEAIHAGEFARISDA